MAKAPRTERSAGRSCSCSHLPSCTSSSSLPSPLPSFCEKSIDVNLCLISRLALKDGRTQGRTLGIRAVSNGKPAEKDRAKTEALTIAGKPSMADNAPGLGGMKRNFSSSHPPVSSSMLMICKEASTPCHSNQPLTWSTSNPQLCHQLGSSNPEYPPLWQEVRYRSPDRSARRCGESICKLGMHRRTSWFWAFGRHLWPS